MPVKEEISVLVERPANKTVWYLTRIALPSVLIILFGLVMMMMNMTGGILVSIVGVIAVYYGAFGAALHEKKLDK